MYVKAPLMVKEENEFATAFLILLNVKQILFNALAPCHSYQVLGTRYSKSCNFFLNSSFLAVSRSSVPGVTVKRFSKHLAKTDQKSFVIF